MAVIGQFLERSNAVCPLTAADVQRDFASYVEQLCQREHSPSPLVPDTAYWAVRDGAMVGRISIRHHGGVFVDVCDPGDGGPRQKRFWITLT